nr:MAG TPA: hypothetical protein [Caudoviricetes sp.]
MGIPRFAAFQFFRQLNQTRGVRMKFDPWTFVGCLAVLAQIGGLC